MSSSIKESIILAYLHGGCGHYCLATKQAETVAHKSQHTDENLRGTPTDSENVCTSCRCGGEGIQLIRNG